LSKFERYEKKGESYYVYPHKHCKQCGQMIEESLTYCSECYQKLKEKKKKKKNKRFRIKKTSNSSEKNEES
jgi:predicted nucleic acid-binding Zn ribbon protein